MKLRVAFWLLAVGAGLASCKREPDFDERYAAAREKIGRTAKDIDARIAATGVPMPEETDAAP